MAELQSGARSWLLKKQKQKTKAFALPCLLRGVTAVILGSHELVDFCYYYLKEEILAGHYEKGWGHGYR